ncbi:hypothetical protein H6F42_04815 [Pseudanabaena sp. FACHB-1998]|uniref:hypothetical protein n=1 Tax=Pseudanabaena sp. FACHB-1998 TaxID=2692858 RepID=UPI0016800C21|nr:hypothetical protein [Pseudanabaena sp. FACHB-1998]MBD2176240.1 hypothetical protein [Pseudanabaena sp. FACHB-1998]
MQNIAMITSEPTIASVTELAINVNTNSFMDTFNTDGSLLRLREILEFVQILTVTAKKIVQEAILAATQETTITGTREAINQESITLEFLTDISSDCKNILRYLTYALIGTDALVLEQLSLKSVQSPSQSLQIQFLITVVRQIQRLAVPLLKNPDIVTELDSYFANIISRIDDQDPLRIRNNQSQGLAKLAEEWLAEDIEDPNEQEETWNYLRNALNNGTLSHRPIPA